jgi:hypothetical protein
MGSKPTFAANSPSVSYADKGSIPKQIFSLFKLLLLKGAWPDFLRLTVAA